jgi:hypothetical protein
MPAKTDALFTSLESRKMTALVLWLNSREDSLLCLPDVHLRLVERSKACRMDAGR